MGFIEMTGETQNRQVNYGDLTNIEFGYYEEGMIRFFNVTDYERALLKVKMTKPRQKVIKAKKITIVFGYP